MRFQGRITTWKDDRGFGFITPDGGGPPIFVHISSFTRRQRRPAGDELVTYQLALDGQERLQAKAVAFADERPTHSGRPLRNNNPLLFSICYLFAVGAAVHFGWLPSAVLGIYLVASIVTYIVYEFDKSAAKQNQWRTAESTLHTFALFGGWPGAVAAQQILRHKSVKRSFQVAFWGTVVLNCLAVGWLMSPSGAKLLHAVLRDGGGG